MNAPQQTRRRTVLGWGAALVGGCFGPQATPAFAAESGEGPEPPRLALLIGNRDYPNGEDLPPIFKNVHDLHGALVKRGFEVTDALDLDAAGANAQVQAFAARVRAAPADSTVLFYFSGHGAQVDAENLLVGAHQSPSAAPDALIKGSVALSENVLGALPKPASGLTIAIVDACRVSLKAQDDGLNQMEAPPGCLIAFATGAGKPAIAPADDTRNTFYTASLVKLLDTASDEITFSDLFRLVKNDVEQTMENYPVPLLRQFAQHPFIAENTRVQRRLAPRVAQAAAAAPARFNDSDEAGDFARLEAAIWPAEVARLADEFLKKHPQSKLAGSAQVALLGAQEASQKLLLREVHLFRGDFEPAPGAGPEQSAELVKSGRGDKDAAARLARQFPRNPKSPLVTKYLGWNEYATALGNGIAAYDLALYYRRSGQPLLAAQYEARARSLGYTPPPSLDNSRK